jgi:hypothetical protein
MPSPLALALMQQQPIAAPPQVNVSPTDVAQIYKNSQDAALAAYQSQLNQRNAMWKNLTTLGAIGVGALAGPMAGSLVPLIASQLKGSQAASNDINY